MKEKEESEEKRRDINEDSPREWSIGSSTACPCIMSDQSSVAMTRPSSCSSLLDCLVWIVMEGRGGRRKRWMVDSLMLSVLSAD